MELTIGEALQQGVAAHKEGKLQEAERFYRAILTNQPEHPDANHNMGVLAVGVGKVIEALPYFKIAVETNFNVEQYWLSYLDALIKLNNIDEAKSIFAKAEAQGIRGQAFDQIERRLNPNLYNKEITDLSSLLDEAAYLRERGDLLNAIKLLNNNFKYFSQDAKFLSFLARYYLLDDDIDRASIYLNNAKKIDPGIPSIGWNEARLYLKKQQLPFAIKTARLNLDKYPEVVEGIVVLASCLMMNNDLSDASRYLDKAILLDPTYSEAFIARGTINLQQNNIQTALNDFESAYNLKPHLKHIYSTIINLKIQMGQFSETIVMLKNLLEHDPNNEEYYFNIGLCNSSLKNMDAAIDAYTRALELNPRRADIHENLGVCEHKNGNMDAAIKSYKRALEIKPELVTAYFNVGQALGEVREHEEAIKYYNRASLIEPENPRYHRFYGFTPNLFARPSLVCNLDLIDSINNGDWDNSLSLLAKVCNQNLRHIEGYRNEFVALWCDFCHLLFDSYDLKKLVKIFLKINILVDRNQDVDFLIRRIFDVFTINDLSNLLDHKDKCILATSYCQYEFSKSNFPLSNKLAKANISNAKVLLENSATEDLGWLIIKRNLSLHTIKVSARQELEKVILETESLQQ